MSPPKHMISFVDYLPVVLEMFFFSVKTKTGYLRCKKSV